MVKYKIKLVVVDAIQWFKNGDHPEDNTKIIIGSDGGLFRSEGKIVRYYRVPELDGQHECQYCGDIMHNHGWIDNQDGGYNVCPGDWIIKGALGEYYVCHPNYFEKMYEECGGADSAGQ